MPSDILIPQSTTSQIRHFMLRSATTGQGVTGKTATDFTGKYNINGGAEVTLSFSTGTAGDAYSSGKIVPLGLGKYAWHVPDTLYATAGSVSAVLACADAIDVHFDWHVDVVNRGTAAFGANTTTPPTKAELDAAQASIESDIALISGLVLSPSPTVERVFGDEDAIRFSWPVGGATITGEVSKAGGAYAAVTGSISQRADEGDTYWYQLAYNAADRQLGSVRYKFTDGTYTRYVNLLVNPASAEVDESAIAGAVWTNSTRGLTEEVTTDAASREASKADVSALALQATLNDVLIDTGTTLPATLTTIASYIDTEVALIKAKTDNLPIDPATETTLSVLDGLIDAIKAVTDTLSLAAISTNVRTEMDTNSTKLASILEDTGTTLPATLNTIDGIVDQILVDTNELQLNQNNWLTADVSGLATQASVNAIDAVVDAILTDTSTTLPAVLTTIDSVVDQILIDTNELQLNQGNWVTATGFSTLTSADIRTAVGLGSANLDTQLGNIPTVAEFEARTLPSGSYFDPTIDTVARVTLVDTVTVNTDMVSITGITTELAKVPKVGQTHRYSQVAVDAENKTADVSISTVS